jgi:hypothetical protein
VAARWLVVAPRRSSRAVVVTLGVFSNYSQSMIATKVSISLSEIARFS